MKTTEQKKDGLSRLEETGMFTRSLRVTPSTFNSENRSVRAVLTTENPVDTYDWSTGTYIPEILLSDGITFPSSGQMPLLDSHARWSVKDQLGSIRNFSKDQDGHSGDLVFSSDDDGERAATKVREGHLTDVSIGYIPTHVRIEKGQTYTHNGRTFTGPLLLSVKTDVREGSLTPIGADSYAKVRSAALNEKKEVEALKERVADLENENGVLKIDNEQYRQAIKLVTLTKE